LVRRVIKEQTSTGNPFKEQIADLIKDIDKKLSQDFWRDTDDLLVIYKKLLPLKGKMVSKGQIPRYREMDYDEQQPMPALHYFNRMFGRIPNNEYGMGDPFNFIDRIKQVSDNTAGGNIEKSKDGKYTTPQVKYMIWDLVQKG
jgi:hypothetical protein